MQTRRCPALFISAAGSNHGKTTVTAALARFHRDRGARVRVFKAGPDYLDPMILERASGHPVYQLDLWMGGTLECGRLLYEAAGAADVMLIEGVMGLFDGSPSSADLACAFGVPVAAVIDATGVAETVGAIAYGLAHMRAGLPFAGVLANRLASARHAQMIEQGIPPGMRYFGALPRDGQIMLLSRHLGLLQAEEIGDLDGRLAVGASLIASTGLAQMPEPVEFKPYAAEAPPQLLAGLRIGVARDVAFSFLYRANLDLLHALGADLAYFSPLNDNRLPEVDSLYLAGGYPEVHARQLQNNAAMKAAVRQHFAAGKPIYAECGGMLYLLESLTDKAGERNDMVGLLPGHATMQPRLSGLGYQSVPTPRGVLRGHTFHHSLIETPLAPVARGERLHGTADGEGLFRHDHLTATYLHCYFPSNPPAAAQLFLR